MKKEDRIRMLLNMERYNEEQLEQMLEDTNIPTPDTEKEWQRFKARKLAQQPKQHRFKPMQWAAMFITLAALSGISYAAISHFVSAKEDANVTTTTVVDEKANAVKTASVEEKTDTVRTAQNFNNVQLQDIMNQLNKDFGVKVVFNNENARKIRLYLSWEADDKLQDIVNRINHFEKVHLTLSDETITIE